MRSRPGLVCALASAAAVGCEREEWRFDEPPALAGRAIKPDAARRPVERRVPLGASAMPPGGAPPGPGPRR
ncbi:MAG TPA: hypothetical protein VFS43_40440 [Polyangiaceae bacterium]|nr:hypothetical protein [Polyangiaceae bacterium]